MEKDNVIKLCTIRSSANESETLASMMRNAGYPIRASHVEDLEDLQEALKHQTFDIVLCALKTPAIKATQVLEFMGKSGKDIPVVVTLPQYEEKLAAQLMEAGARDAIPETSQKLLLLTISRELADLKERRKHRQTNIMYMESEKRNRSLMESSRDAIAYLHEGMHIYVNSSYLELFGYAHPEDVESIPIMDMISGEDQKSFKNILKQLSKGENPDTAFEFKAITASGDSFSAKMEFATAAIEGEQCTQIIIRNTANNEGNEELQKELDALKRQDLVTGLYNRNHFLEQLEATLKSFMEHKGGHGALVQIELDQFKKLQEALGAAAADLLLSDFATLLKKCVGPKDVAARYAGDIFTIIYNNKDIANVQKICEGIRKGVENHIFEVEGQSITSTCSIGIYRLTEQSATVKNVLNYLEMACKKAHADGGNRAHLHSVDDEMAKNEEDRKWIQVVRSALQKDAFHLAFQPIVSLHAEPGEKYEVLIRLRDKQGAEIPPTDFLGPAEQAGLMREIDRWVIRQCAKVLVKKRSVNTDLRLFIKLSQDSLKDQTLLVWISKLLKAARLHGDCMVFEASEPLVLASLKETKTFISGLKQLHCLFAVDHVGLESADFSYLNHLDASYLKISGSLISAMLADDTKKDRVKAIADRGTAEKRKTIASHVQDPNTLALLWQFGVNFIQGNYLQPPNAELAYDFTAKDDDDD